LGNTNFSPLLLRKRELREIQAFTVSLLCSMKFSLFSILSFLSAGIFQQKGIILYVTDISSTKTENQLPCFFEPVLFTIWKVLITSSIFSSLRMSFQRQFGRGKLSITR